MPPYILLILLLPVLQGCLVVRTPKCECPVLALSSSNIAQNVGNHVFYQNVSGYPMTEPVVKSEDCSVSMYCEGDYSLVVFDKETATTFGAYSADGFCDPRNQKWQIDTTSGFTSFDRLFGICVDYAPIIHCACPIHQISSNFIAKELLTEFYPEAPELALFQYSEPVWDIIENECPVTFGCKEKSGHGRITIYDGKFDLREMQLLCDPAKKTWIVFPLGRQNEMRMDVNFLGVGCFEIGTCPSGISCPYKTVDNPRVDLADHPSYRSIDQYYNYQLPEVTIDGCQVTMSCSGNYRMGFLNSQRFYIWAVAPQSLSAQCILDRMWSTLFTEPTDMFIGICVDYSSKRTTRMPPMPTTTPKK